MCGFGGGESNDTVIRKTGYRDEAKRQWSCLTTLDLSQIKNEEQLVAMVKVRYGLPYETAKADVDRILRRQAPWRLAHSREWQTSWRVRVPCCRYKRRGGGGPSCWFRSESLQHRDCQPV